MKLLRRTEKRITKDIGLEITKHTAHQMKDNIMENRNIYVDRPGKVIF